MQNNYKYCAFFDVDGTILSIKTMFSFLEYYDKKSNLSQVTKSRYDENKKNFDFCVKEPKNSREFINTMYYRLFAGIAINYLNELGRDWFAEVFNEKHLNCSTMKEVNFHKRNGAAIVLVSGSMNSCLDPLVRIIGATYVLCTKQEVVNGIITGKILQPQTIGAGKVIAMKNLCTILNNIDLKLCFAYGDHISDIHMLESVGYPYVVKGDYTLEKIALKKGWSII